MANVRWTLTEKATSATWTMPVNPNTMTPLPREKNLATISSVNQDRPRTIQVASPAQQISWGGVILTQAHYDNLHTWANKPGIIVVRDHLLREFEVLITAFRPAPEPGRRPGDRKQKYTMDALFLRRLA